MKAFDDYEIHGVAEFTDLHGNRYCEPVPDDEANSGAFTATSPAKGWSASATSRPKARPRKSMPASLAGLTYTRRP